MANTEHLAALKKGVNVWNVWRGRSSERPDLFRADLRSGKLSWAILHDAGLGGAKLSGADLSSAELSNADLRDANLRGADLRGANLRGANLRGANLRGANLRDADLRSANLRSANLRDADFRDAILGDAILSGALVSGTMFTNVDLSTGHDLAQCRHHGRSTVDHRTLEKSGTLPLTFLRGIGYSERFIDSIPSLFGKGIDFYSAFLSHNSEDKEFVRCLSDRLQGQGVRCWLDEKQIRPGDDLGDEIERGIQIRDKLVLVCSERSLKSWWVKHEWKKAMDKERRWEKERGETLVAIIPIDIDGFIYSDECKVSVKSEILSRSVADFTEWKDHDAFERALGGLVEALRADGGGGAAAGVEVVNE